jgi:hypothetical protein
MPVITCVCGKSYRLQDGLAGKTFRCKACNTKLTVPAVDAALSAGLASAADHASIPKPARETAKSADGAMASNPGRMDFSIWHFMKCQAGLIWYWILCPIPFGVYAGYQLKSLPLGVIAAVVIAVGIPLMVRKKMKPKFQVGDLCPAVVVATSPFRVAVLADMANDGGRPKLAVGVTTQSLGKCFATPPRKGTRFVTVCYYSGQMGSGSWSDLLPTVINMGCTNQEQLDRAMASMNPADFELLNRLTPTLKSDRNGLYKLWEMPEFAAEFGGRR